MQCKEVLKLQDFINILQAKWCAVYDDLYNTGKNLWETSEKQVGIAITLNILSENAS